MWYTREEQALVIGAFYSMNGFQQCVGGLIAYGIAHIEHARLKNWQVLFTVCSCLFPVSRFASQPEIVAWMCHSIVGYLRLVVAPR